jgi:DNA polymerase III subunit alpha
VGPGRGSGAGSLVAYALTITDLDPLRYGLLFERFLNPERISMPDFDIDFCMDRREEVIAYVQERYGRDRVAQIITFGALLSKAAVRDVGRVLQMPYGQVDRLSKMIPVEGVKPVSVEKALADEPRLREEARRDPQVARCLEIARQIEGLYRNASTHAAGVVIGDRPLVELVPLYRDPKSEMPATQFNMKWVEEAGLVKFDFLGLKNLTVIQQALELLAARGGERRHRSAFRSTIRRPTSSTPAPTRWRCSRWKARACARRCASCGRPASRTSSRSSRSTGRGRWRTSRSSATSRTGGRSGSLHPSIDPILDETQGIIVYQEQVMEIARKMAGYSLGGADLLRRAMGKKIKEAMDAEKPKFLEGAAANGVAKGKAEEVWNLLERFANYGFNKSHAAAYALVSYQTAWLKANHPVEFMAAVMNCDIHLTDKLAVYKQRGRPARDRDRAAVRQPLLRRLRGGGGAHPLCARRAEGRRARGDAADRGGARREAGFADLFDLARRVDLRRVGKRPARDAGAGRGLRRARAQPAARAREPRHAGRLFRRDARRAGLGAGEPLRRRAGALALPRLPRWRTGRRWSGCSRSTRRSASTFRATRSTTISGRCGASGS